MLAMEPGWQISQAHVQHASLFGEPRREFRDDARGYDFMGVQVTDRESIEAVNGHATNEVARFGSLL